jgi:hypothetical protein
MNPLHQSSTPSDQVFNIYQAHIRYQAQSITKRPSATKFHTKTKLVYSYYTIHLKTFVPRRAKSSWISKVMSALYAYHYKIWTAQNAIIHETSPCYTPWQVNHRSNCMNLLQQVELYYQPHSELDIRLNSCLQVWF